MEQVIYLALEPVAAHRYANAHDFAHDLTHLKDVEIEGAARSRNLNNKTAIWTRNIWLYVVLAAIPILLFVLMMLATHHG